MKDKYRGTGRTTAQIKNAPKDAVYVWCNPILDYPKRLAKELERYDLQIVSPSWIASGKFRGLKLSGLVVDHACDLANYEFEMLNECYARVRT